MVFEKPTFESGSPMSCRSSQLGLGLQFSGEMLEKVSLPSFLLSSQTTNNKQHHQQGIFVIYAIHAPKFSSSAIYLSMVAQKNWGKQLGKKIRTVEFSQLGLFFLFFSVSKQKTLTVASF